MEIQIKVRSSAPRMGVESIHFDVNLGATGFERFLSVLPEGQRDYYSGRFKESGEPSVNVVMPVEYQNSFDLSDPVRTLQDMYVAARKSHLVTQENILGSMVRSLVPGVAS